MEPLIAALADPDKELARAAAEALGKLRDARAVAPLIEALGDGDAGVRGRAAWSLVDVGDARAVEPLIVALGDDSLVVRGGAAYALGRIRDPRAVEPLIGRLWNYDDRRTAAQSLAQIGDVRAVKPLLDALTFDREGAQIIGRLGPAAVEPLIAALGDPDNVAPVRKLIAYTLGQIGDQRGVEPLIAALEDPDVDVEEAAADALESLGFEAQDVETSVACLVARGRWDRCVEIGPPAVERLIVALKRGWTPARGQAAESLARIGDARAVVPLCAALQDRERYVREAAATALESLGWQPDDALAGATYRTIRGDWERCAEIGAAAVEPLIGVLGDDDGWIRRGAAQALVDIWRSGKLGPAERKALLAAKGTITAPHTDSYHRFRGDDEHDDYGIGVEFPL